MHVVAGLGNPGAPYVGTRHNVGFAVVELLAHQMRGGAWQAAPQALTCRVQLDGQPVLLVKPQSFMNESGEPVAALLRYYRTEPAQLVVVHDELDFAPGDLRLKWGGGHGGHNGLRSLLRHVPGDFARVRIGIGKPTPPRQGVDWVLSRFAPSERSHIEDATVAAGLAVEAIVRRGWQAAAQQFNAR